MTLRSRNDNTLRNLLRPLQQHPRLVQPCLFRDLLHDLVDRSTLELRDRAQRAVTLDGDIVLLTELDEGVGDVVHVGVELDLVGGGGDLYACRIESRLSCDLEDDFRLTLAVFKVSSRTLIL